MATSWEAYKKKRKEGDISPTSSWNSYAASREADKLIRTNTSTSKKVEEDIAPVKSSEDRSWFKSGAFSDGYQFGDITKTILGTAGNVADSLATGVAKIGEGAIDTALYAAGGIAKLKGNDTASNIAKALISVDTVDIAKSVNNEYRSKAYYGGKLDEQKYLEENTVLGDKSSSLVQSAGQLVGTAALQAVGVPWWATTGVTSFGSGTQEAFNNDATYGEAGAYGLINAGAEVLTEKISGGISFGGVTLDAGLKDVLFKNISNNTIKTLGKFGFDAAGEGFEEVLTEVIQNVGKKLTYEDEQTWKEILASPEALDAYLESFIGGAVLGGGSSAINSIRNNNDIAPVENEAQIEEQVEGLQQALEEKQNELKQSQDAREQQIIQEEVEVLQEELTEATNAQQITEAQTESKQETPKQDTSKTVVNDKGVQLDIGDTIRTFNNSTYEVTDVFTTQDGTTRAKLKDSKGYETSIGINAIDENLTDPAKNNVSTLTENDSLSNSTAVEQQGQQDFERITDEQAPIEQEDTTPEATTEQTKVESPLENRDIDEVGNKKVKSYQYENPEVRPYFQQEAQNMIHDLDNTIKGEKGMTQDELGNTEFYGTTRQTAEAIAYLKDNYGYSYEQIRKGLNDIIDGKENNAVAKRIEFLLDERLREGYITSDGMPIPPNEEYMQFLNEKNITEYNQQISENLATTDEHTPINENQENSLQNMEDVVQYTQREKDSTFITVAPYYNTQLTKENFESIKNAVDKDFKDAANKFSSMFGAKIEHISTNIGGFTFQEGETAGQFVKELSYTFELKDVSTQDADLISSLLGDLGHEQQEAVISANYLDSTSNEADALEFRIGVKDANGVEEALSKAGINDYTIDTTDNSIKILEFDMDNPQGTIDKLKSLAIELGGNYNGTEESKIQSRYLDTEARRSLYQSRLATNEANQQNGELNNYISRALQKIEQSTNQELDNSSFFNAENNTAPIEEVIAPLEEKIDNLTKQLDTVVNSLEQSKVENTDIAPTTQNMFELTDEQNARIQELRDDTEKWKQVYNERYDDKKFAQKRIKGVAMQNAADIRKITQGDWLIPIEGGLTENELSALKNKLRNNYVGKQVLVDGKEGTVVGNAYGKIGVEFADGTKQYVNKNLIQPLEDIDNIIQEQQRMYEQYKQSIAPEPQESPTINQNTQNEQLIPMAETTAQNQNTELSDTSTETQEQEKIAEILPERPTQENKKQRLWAKIKAALFDKGAVFEDLSIKNKNRELMAKWDYMLTAEARAQSVMINGHKQFDSDTKTETQTTKSLNDIQTEVGDKVQEFSEYLYHKHNISRMSLESNAQARMEELQNTALTEYDTEAIEKLSRKRITEKTDEETAALIETAKEYVRLSEVKNKPVFGKSVTADVSKEIVNEYEMNNPEFMDWANDVYNYNKANLDQLVQGGVISQETADQFAEIYPDYVPIGRANKNGNAVNVPLDTNRTGINAPIARAKGGNGDILPLFDTMAKRTIQTYRAVAKNNFGVELKNTLKGNTINETTNVDEVLENVDQQESLLQEGKDGKAPTFTVFENGEKVTYEITQDMYEALKPVSDSSLLSTTFKPFNKISNFHRGVLTEYNPVFMLTNSIKDFQDVLLNSQHAAKTYSKFGESYAQIIKKGYWYKEYMANGGEQNSYFDSQEGTFNAERKGMAKVLDTFPLKQISQLNNVIEMAPRLAEYIASREAGRSIETSMLDAARVTTNFKAGGDLTKWANRNGATFLNASVQGAMQQVRNVREANMNGLKGYANLATKFALAGVPAMILNAMLWGDDEEYEELSDYVKQSYWIVGKYGDGNFIRIPKGRMVTVIQESFNQMKNAITGDDEVDLGQFLEVMATNIAPNNPIENNVLSPIIGVIKNKAWYGDDLVPTRLQDVPAEEQYDESIDKLSIALGQSLGISPYKINYVLDQYSGGVGDMLLPLMTPQAETSSDSVGSKLIAPLTSKFGVDSVMKNQNASDLYTLSEELTTKANSSKATDEEILQNKYINSVKSEMNELYKAKRELQNSDIPDSEKYNQVREIQKQINSKAKEAVDSYKDVTIKSNYSTAGGKEYYKNNKGEWASVREEEATDLQELNMSNEDKNTYFKTKSEISKIVGTVSDTKEQITIDDEDSEEYKNAVSLLNSEKKESIVNKIVGSGLKDKEKAYLYKKFYNSDTVDTMVNTGISVDDYLIYTTKEFKADYNYKGNAISGSRKNKVVSYVNSLEMTIPQKAILIKSTNTFKFNDYNNDIVSYVSDLDLEYKDKVKLLKDLDMTVTDDGTVKWK